MAGTLVLDLGTSLFLSAVTATNFSLFEYASVWVILVVMMLSNMTTALVAGLVLALFNYTQQSFVVGNPMRRISDVSKMPSTCVRSIEALQVLDNDPIHGRMTVILFQMQGHLFYGNFPKLKEEILQFLRQKKDKNENVTMAIMDLDFVVGIDSSAAALIEKFVTSLEDERGIETVFIRESHFDTASPVTTHHSQGRKQLFSSMSMMTTSFDIWGEYYKEFDEALIVCEDELLIRHKAGLEKKYTDSRHYQHLDVNKTDLDHERETILMLLSKYNAGHAPPHPHRFTGPNETVLVEIYQLLKRETYSKGEFLWHEGDTADSAKLILKGSFTAMSKDCSSHVKEGSIIGLHTLLLAETRSRGIRCDSDGSIGYRLDMDGYEMLSGEAARVVDMSMARNLSLRFDSVKYKTGATLSRD